MHVIHQPGFICVQGFLLRGHWSFGYEIVSSKGRIIDQKLPFEMTAGTIIQVADLTGVKVSGGIVIDLAIDVTMLEEGHRMAILASADIGSGNVIDTSSGFY